MNRSNCKRYLMILPAAFSSALTLDLFFLPFKIVTGEVVGISTIFHSAFGFNMSIMILAINIPILLMAPLSSSEALFFANQIRYCWRS